MIQNQGFYYFWNQKFVLRSKNQVDFKVLVFLFLDSLMDSMAKSD